MGLDGRCMPKHAIALMMFSLALSSCTHKSHLIKKQVFIAPTTQQPPSSHTSFSCITVLVHGTKLITCPLYNQYFNGKAGLKAAQDFPLNSAIYKDLIALSHGAPDFFSHENLYFFGWSGKLRVKERDEAAEVLYDALTNLSDNYYQSYGIHPSIRLICHSHGGNIALTLARIHAQKKHAITVESLIVLACPVQLSTKDFVACTLFERVYAFYSTLDLVQIIAPEIAHYVHNEKGELVDKKRRWLPFSERRFNQYPHVKQARIKIDNHAAFHSSFTTMHFLQALPVLIHMVDDAYKEHEHALIENKKEVLCAIRKQTSVPVA